MITAGRLAAILMRADEDAEVRFWIGKDEEVEFDVAYDNVDDGGTDPDKFVALNADVVNIDLEPIDEEEILGAGDDDLPPFDSLEYME